MILMNNSYKFFPYVVQPKSNLATQIEKKRKREYNLKDSSNENSPSPFINGTPIISETSTESVIDLYISINDSQVIQIINDDSKEAEDTTTNKRFFVATGGGSYYNKEMWHTHSLKTSIELAVCGGNFYALLMGQGQPEYFVGKGGVDEDLGDDLEPVYYRVGSKIEFLAEGADIFNCNKSVKSLIFSLIISYFLGDSDVSNVVGIAEDEHLLIKRLDPEFCFSSYFSEESNNNYNSVLKELSFIFNLNTDNHELTQEEIQHLVKKNEVDFFGECFTKTLLMHPTCLKILSSEVRTNELLSALQKITETPFTQYEKIIDQIISNETISIQLKETLKKRLEIFSQIYLELVAVAQPQEMPALPETENFIEGVKF